MAYPEPANVAPWYLRNINQALALNEVTGNVYLRTDSQLTIGNVGNVNVTEVAIAELGNIDISGNTMPVSGNVTVFQGTSPWVVTGNANVVITSGNVGLTGNLAGITGNVNIGTMPAITGNVNANITGTANVNVTGTYEMNVAQGLIDGQYAEMKNGVALDLSQGAEATIWSQNTLYPWASWTTAQKLYIISSSASDTGQVLRIEGLDANFAKITEDVTTNGTTAVATTLNFLRLNRCYMLTGATNVGTITQRLASGVGTVIGSMAIGYSRNKGGFFTVPAGYTAYILYGDATSFRGGSGNIGSVIKMFTRTNVTGVTTPFMNQFMSEVVNGQYRNEFNIPLLVPEKTDIDVRMTADGNNTQATCNWQMILIPN